MMNGYCFDAAACSLTISPSFAKKASVIGSPEYDIIVKARKENPGLKIIVADKKAGKAKITFAQMEAFISLHKNSKELMKQYNGMRILAKIQPSPYSFMKNWFDKVYPYFSTTPEIDLDGHIVVPKKEEDNTPTVAEEETEEPAA